jgi:hypothetical protein
MVVVGGGGGTMGVCVVSIITLGTGRGRGHEWGNLEGDAAGGTERRPVFAAVHVMPTPVSVASDTTYCAVGPVPVQDTL